VIVFLGGIAWIGSHELDPLKALKSAASPLEVEVVSLHWRWLFIYPSERIATVNYLVIPTDVPVHFRSRRNRLEAVSTPISIGGAESPNRGKVMRV
jgi:heme/copper-type cytochrome/quinol oxidase subunit 2